MCLAGPTEDWTGRPCSVGFWGSACVLHSTAAPCLVANCVLPCPPVPPGLCAGACRGRRAEARRGAGGAAGGPPACTRAAAASQVRSCSHCTHTHGMIRSRAGPMMSAWALPAWHTPLGRAAVGMLWHLPPPPPPRPGSVHVVSTIGMLHTQPPASLHSACTTVWVDLPALRCISAHTPLATRPLPSQCMHAGTSWPAACRSPQRMSSRASRPPAPSPAAARRRAQRQRASRTSGSTR